nr:pilus assembly protein [uncultured Lachnoclostridium sp.]
MEAALAMPLFFFAVVALCYLSEVMAIRTSIRSGLQYAGKAAAESAYERPLLLPGSIEQDLVKAVGEERLDRSIVENGSSGVRCERSYMSMSTGIMELRADYRVYLPLPVFGRVVVPMEESCRVKGWTGYERAGFLAEDEETVYITETGMVYHRDPHCNYLELSIRMVPAGEIEHLRNESQGKYYPCESCSPEGAGGGVYITDHGDRYHGSLDCSGLKRTVYAVPLSEAVGKGACSKCG